MTRSESERTTQTKTDPQRWLSAIESALDRLHFLASVIRSASIRDQDKDAFTFTSTEERTFHGLAISYVRWKCPHARPSLREHVGGSIAARRQALLQKHRHAKRLKARRTNISAPGHETKAPVVPVVEKRLAKVPVRGIHARTTPSATASKATQASRLDERVAMQRIRNKPTLSIRSSGSALPESSISADYPKPPKTEHGEKRVQCPYCLKPLSVTELRKGTKNEYWR